MCARHITCHDMCLICIIIKTVESDGAHTDGQGCHQLHLSLSLPLSPPLSHHHLEVDRFALNRVLWSMLCATKGSTANFHAGNLKTPATKGTSVCCKHTRVCHTVIRERERWRESVRESQRTVESTSSSASFFNIFFDAYLHLQCLLYWIQFKDLALCNSNHCSIISCH